jgi:hypothetical protein
MYYHQINDIIIQLLPLSSLPPTWHHMCTYEQPRYASTCPYSYRVTLHSIVPCTFYIQIVDFIDV